MESVEKLVQMLAKRKFCRICLTESGNLMEYSNRHEWKTILMSCFAISTINAEKLTKIMCDACRDFLDKCREFKQMCTKTELIMMNYPCNGVWSGEVMVTSSTLRPVQKRQSQQTDALFNNKNREKTIDLTECDEESKIGTVRVRPYESLTVQSPIVSSDVQAQFSAEQANSNRPSVIQYTQNQPTQNCQSATRPYPQCEPSPAQVTASSQTTSSYPQQLHHTTPLPRQCLSNFFARHVPQQQQQQLQSPPQSTSTCPPENIPTVQAVFLQRPSKQPLLAPDTQATRSIQPAAQPPPPPPTLPIPPGFHCTTCSLVFASQKHLVQHARKHNGIGMFYCSCGKLIVQFTATVDHLKRDHTAAGSKRPKRCVLCGDLFPARRRLVSHLDQHMEAGLRQCCDFCGLVFLDRDSRVRHMFRDHGEELQQLKELNPNRVVL